MTRPTAARVNVELKETDLTFQYGGNKQSGVVDNSTRGAVNKTEYNPEGEKEALQYM